jgi:hypothetical protein
MKIVIESINETNGKMPETRKTNEDTRDKGRITNPMTGVIIRFVMGDTREK